MDVLHFTDFSKLKYVHHTTDTHSGFQWAAALALEKADSVITHLLEVTAIMGMSLQVKMDKNGPAYVSNKMRQFCTYYNIKHVTDISHNPARQVITERSNQTLKEMLNRQEETTKPPRDRSQCFINLRSLNANEQNTTAAEKH